MRTESWTPKKEFNRCTQKNRKIRHSKGTALYNWFARMTAERDLIIGSIANDRMFYVLDNFFLEDITDVALVRSLSALQLGKQYVAKTQNACNQVRIEREIPLSYLEKECLKETSKFAGSIRICPKWNKSKRLSRPFD